MTHQACICDAGRTPFGRYGGALSSVRADDLGAVPLCALMKRNRNVDWQAVPTSSTAAPTRPARTIAGVITTPDQPECHVAEALRCPNDDDQLAY